MILVIMADDHGLQHMDSLLAQIGRHDLFTRIKPITETWPSIIEHAAAMTPHDNTQTLPDI